MALPPRLDTARERHELLGLPLPRPLEIAFALIAVGAVSLLFLPWQKWESVITQIPFLRVEEVHVSCEAPLNETKVLSWLPPLKGRNIVLLQASSLMKSLREKPWVESVVIRKEYPSRIFIDITTKSARALKVVGGSTIIVDRYGREIEKTTPETLRALNLPILTAESETIEDQWDLAEVLRVLETSQKAFGKQLTISQVYLSAYPYFRFYLASPPTELTFSLETWEGNLPRATRLLQHPPKEIAQPRKINLVLPKKAIVSPLLSN